jgi:hypothetical protein
MNRNRIAGFLGVPVEDRRRDYTDVIVRKGIVLTLSSGHRIILEPRMTLGMEGELARTLERAGLVAILPAACNRGR